MKEREESGSGMVHRVGRHQLRCPAGVAPARSTEAAI